MARALCLVWLELVIVESTINTSRLVAAGRQAPTGGLLFLRRSFDLAIKRQSREIGFARVLSAPLTFGLAQDTIGINLVQKPLIERGARCSGGLHWIVPSMHGMGG